MADRADGLRATVCVISLDGRQTEELSDPGLPSREELARLVAGLRCS